MPTFAYEPRTVNDKSNLTPGYHPAFLLAIKDEEVPEGWEMKKKSPRMWRWCFAVFTSPEQVAAGGRPEHQSATSSQTFSPGGKFQPSKAYIWTCKIMGRKIESGESIDLDPMMPIPCLVMVSRTKRDGTHVEYANIDGIEPWPEGPRFLTPGLRQSLAAFLAEMDQPAPQGPQHAAPQGQPGYSQAPPAGYPGVPQPQYHQAPPGYPQPPVGYPQPPAGYPQPQGQPGYPQPQQPTLPGVPPQSVGF